MKLLLSALLSVPLVLGGCGQNKSNVSESGKQIVVSDAAQGNFAQVTTRLNDAAFGGVDAINDVTSPKRGTIVPITGDKIVIAGNYVDAIRGEAAAGVVVLIDNKPFVTAYGGERPDIAKALSNPKYLKSQFYIEVPTSTVGKGVHDLAIKVIASDKSGYYETGLIAQLDVK